MTIALVIVDLDGVVVNSDKRFERAEQAKQSALARNATDRQAINEYWKTAFTPELVILDTLIEGADMAIRRLDAMAYTIVFLTSRPEHMEAATQGWLDAHDIGCYELVMKPADKQYVKTVQWKTDEVKRMASLPGITAVIFVDDEQVHRDAIESLGLGIACKASLDDYKPDDEPIFA